MLYCVLCNIAGRIQDQNAQWEETISNKRRENLIKIDEKVSLVSEDVPEIQVFFYMQ